jgi:hypothetical protein
LPGKQGCLAQGNSVYKVSIDKKKDFVLVAGNTPVSVSGWQAHASVFFRFLCMVYAFTRLTKMNGTCNGAHGWID